MLVALTSAMVAFADESTTQQPTTSITQEEAQQTLEEQRTQLEKQLKENEEKLKALEKSSKDTEEYIDALDEKIGYLNQELDLLSKEVSEAQAKVDTLDKDINTLKKQISDVQASYDKSYAEYSELTDKFQSTYEAYCQRLRAMYISGSNSILVALLTSKDLSQFLSRYQMIKAITKADTQLLKTVKGQISQLNTTKDQLNTELALLNKDKATLDAKQDEQTKAKNVIESKQGEIATKKVTLAEDRAESDSLLAQLTEKTQMYSEYKYEDEELIKQVDDEISDLLNGLKNPEQVTTASSNNVKPNSSTTNASNESTLYYNSNAVLNLTYPAPGHYGLSVGYGTYSNGKPHPALDFPYPTGSKVVAAQKGIVITAKNLNYSYGRYIMIYHGTDAKGRKIVTLYAHNSKLLVSVGQTVKKGQQIAKGGSTGNSTGPHCHFELIIDGDKVNPTNYLSK